MDVFALEHFKGTYVPGAPEHRFVDILIGQLDKQLLTVLEECEGTSPEEPNYILTGKGPIASGGQVHPVISSSLSALRVQVDSYKDAARECAELKRCICSQRDSAGI